MSDAMSTSWLIHFVDADPVPVWYDQPTDWSNVLADNPAAIAASPIPSSTHQPERTITMTTTTNEPISAKLLENGTVLLSDGKAEMILTRDRIGGIADMCGHSPIERAAIPLVKARERLDAIRAILDEAKND